jgi:mRNA-degrading endonuclease RelE of RelBE toxin-antitoxin system
MSNRGPLTQWTVTYSRKAHKQFNDLPEKIRVKMTLLTREILESGPIRKNWHHFGKLKDDTYHCHLKEGNPTYVSCWYIVNKELKKVEVFYVGTHENAPY